MELQILFQHVTKHKFANKTLLARIIPKFFKDLVTNTKDTQA